MATNKLLDYYGLLQGHCVEIADAIRAYTQAPYMGIETWVRIPEDQMPEEHRGKFRDPVYKLQRALYGHPDSGTCWETWCNEKMADLGFQPVQGWPSVFTHPKLKILASIYVDDFKLAGPVRAVAEGWRMIAEVIDLEPPTRLDK